MLRITIPGLEYYDEEKNEFIYYDEQTVDLEHSLVSISKWEAKWCKPFLSSGDKSALEERKDHLDIFAGLNIVSAQT